MITQTFYYFTHHLTISLFQYGDLHFPQHIGNSLVFREIHSFLHLLHLHTLRFIIAMVILIVITFINF